MTSENTETSISLYPKTIKFYSLKQAHYTQNVLLTPFLKQKHLISNFSVDAQLIEIFLHRKLDNFSFNN